MYEVKPLTAAIPPKDMTNVTSLTETAEVIREITAEVNAVQLTSQCFVRQPQTAPYPLTSKQIE